MSYDSIFMGQYTPLSQPSPDAIPGGVWWWNWPLERFEQVLSTKLDKIVGLLKEIRDEDKHMSAELDKLTQEVAEIKTVAQSAVTLISGLAEQIRALKDEPAKLEALANDLDATSSALAAAVAANTPASPEPTPTPEEPTPEPQP